MLPGSVKAAVKKLWYENFQDHPYSYLGRVAIPLCAPAYLRRVEEGFLLNPKGQSLWWKILKAGLRRRYFAQDEESIARASREQVWGSTVAHTWHEWRDRMMRETQGAEAFSPEFEQFCTPIVRQLRALIGARSEYTVLCDIGTGNGLLLRYLSRAPGFESHRFVGIDVDAGQVEKNRVALGTARLTFDCMEVGEWIEVESRTGTIFLTNDTLHLFTPGELGEAFEAISRVESSAVMLSEPIDPRLPANVLSRPRGGIGIGFSHNYTAYLKRYGYTIVSREIVKEGPNVPVPAWCRVCAER